MTGGFSLFAEGHRRRGNAARFATIFRTPYGFPEDICFDLFGVATSGWVVRAKRLLRVGDQASQAFVPSGLPFRDPAGIHEKLLIRVRDAINAPRINRVIREHRLNDFDLYHFEQGIDPFRDGRWVKSLAARGKPIVAFYHGSDLRDRGLIREVHEASRLNLTSEIDLLSVIPGMRYLYLPIDTEAVVPVQRVQDGRIRIAHAARNRANKGSDRIEAVVKKLAERYPIDWVMIENVDHVTAMQLKQGSDIFIDQISDSGGWGYGMSSVESLALGIPTITRINSKVAAFLGNHPFVHAESDTLERKIEGLILDPDAREGLGKSGREWVVERHGLESVMGSLYTYYTDAKLI